MHLSIKFSRVVVCLISVSSLFSFSAFATLESDVTSIKNYVNTIESYQRSTNSYIESVYSRLGTLNGYVDGIEGSLSNIYSRQQSINNNLDSIYSRLGTINSHVDGLESSLTTINSNIVSIGTHVSSIDSSVSSLVSSVNTVISSLSNLNSKLSSIRDDTSELVDFFVNPQHKGLEDDSLDSVVAAGSIYNSTSGGLTTAQKISSIGGFGDSISSNLNTGVGSFELFNMFDSGTFDPSSGGQVSIFGFFSQASAENMDSSLASIRSNVRSSEPPIVTDYYYSNYESILSAVGDSNDK